MRLPDSLYDESLLDDDPICSYFYLRKNGCERKFQWVPEISKALLDRESKAVEAVQAWLGIALAPDPESAGRSKRNHPRRITLDIASVEIFVKFYWLLFEGKHIAAQSYLSKERRKRGFQYVLEVPTVTTATRRVRKVSTKIDALGSTSDLKEEGTAQSQNKRASKKRKSEAEDPLTDDSGALAFTSDSNISAHQSSLQLGSQTGSKKVRTQQPNLNKYSKGQKHKKKQTQAISFTSEDTSISANQKKRIRPRTEPDTLLLSQTLISTQVQNKGSSTRISKKTQRQAALHRNDLPIGPPAVAQAHLESIGATVDSLSYFDPVHETTAKFVTSFNQGPLVSRPGNPITSSESMFIDFNSYAVSNGDDILFSRTMAGPQEAKDIITTQNISPILPSDRWDNPYRKLFVAPRAPISSTSLAPEPITKTIQPRPALRQKPPIWAKSRQEVCESLDWFRSYQSGVYYVNKIVKGYLLSAFSSSRDIFHHGGKLIISHGGGKAESLSSRKGSTETQLADDQLAEDKSVRALLSNYRNRRPLVLLIDDRYSLFPFDLAASGVAYAVLGFYTIVHAWAECQPAANDRGKVIRYKFAFQWCDNQGDPWWISNVSVPTSNLEHLTSRADGLASPEFINSTLFLDAAIERQVPMKSNTSWEGLSIFGRGSLYLKCQRCAESSPQVYRLGWICLNPACEAFWRLNDIPVSTDSLDYNLDFLILSPTTAEAPPYNDLRPSLPENNSTDGITTDYAFSRGWHCDKCGRLSCRWKWEHWECSSCQTLYKVSGRFRFAKELKTAINIGPQDHKIGADSGIISPRSWRFDTEYGFVLCQTFELPKGGSLHHIQTRPTRVDWEADSIFKEYQEQAAEGRLCFRRWPLRTHKLRGPLLTNYFSQNCGMPYQYVGGTGNTVSWDVAPNAVISARKLIRDRIYQALGQQIEFNEVLSAAYMEKQKMAFHSDSERGLGPMVAGLSLGAPALMHFRLHMKHEPMKENRKIAITFVLRHGDVLVMDGSNVQEYYEHTVIPTNFRISATARMIDTSHLTN